MAPWELDAGLRCDAAAAQGWRQLFHTGDSAQGKGFFPVLSGNAAPVISR